MARDHKTWDATTTLAALGASEIALWLWEPVEDRLSITGSVRSLGLDPLAPQSSSAALRALVLPQDRARAEDLLRARPQGQEISLRFRMHGGVDCHWRGVWLEDGMRAAGAISRVASVEAVTHDPLTGLKDRQSFINLAREQLAVPGTHELVVADLNRLRRLNDALGHERADLILSALASRLALAFPSSVLTARIGEDEYAVLAPKGALPASTIMRAALEMPLRIAGFDIHPTLSMGTVEVTGGEDAPEVSELLRRAELAVEAAKGGGRGGTAIYGRTLERDGLSHLAMEADLKGALGRGELCAFYQPIVRLSTGALSGFEALVRWRHPRLGLVMPDQFLPHCEEMGLMHELGAMMMGQAARQLAIWRRNYRAAAEMTVAVNLSTGELERPDLVADLLRIRRETGLPKGALKLEVTEGDVMRDPDQAARILGDLRAAGVAIALDDFGTGFSSLSYLTRLPFDTLKIDRYFVRTMSTNEGSAKIVASVIKLGQDLSLEVVAEGVENAQMARILQSAGCDYGQGFGYGPALSPKEAEVYLNESYVDGSAPVKARG